MPRRKSKKCKLPSKTTTAGVLSTLGVASVGSYLSFKYATDVAAVCFSNIHKYLNDGITVVADYEKYVPSQRIELNATIGDAEQNTPLGNITLPASAVFSIFIDTPSFIFRVINFIGEEAVAGARNTVSDIAEAISHHLCYNEVLVHGLVATAALTGLLALLTYTCHVNHRLSDNVAELHEEAEDLQHKLVTLTKALEEKGLLNAEAETAENSQCDSSREDVDIAFKA